LGASWRDARLAKGAPGKDGSTNFARSILPEGCAISLFSCAKYVVRKRAHFYRKSLFKRRFDRLPPSSFDIVTRSALFFDRTLIVGHAPRTPISPAN
jgi:hypothetical protein